MKFLDTLRKKLNLDGFFGDEGVSDKDLRKGKVVYILCLVGENGQPVRQGTHNLDYLKQAILKIPNDRIYYLGRRWGRSMKEVQMFAIFSNQMQEVVCDKMLAFNRLAAAVMSDPK